MAQTLKSAMRKRRRKNRDHRLKPGITVRWCPVERDFVIDSPARPDGHLAYGVLFMFSLDSKGERVLSFVDELKKRGYDTTTLTLTVERLYPPNGTPVPGR
jgi:hypothetical protein